MPPVFRHPTIQTKHQLIKGRSYSHAVLEQVFRCLKEEGFLRPSPETRTQATEAVIDHPTTLYIGQRLHAALGYQSLQTFEIQAA